MVGRKLGPFFRHCSRGKKSKGGGGAVAEQRLASDRWILKGGGDCLANGLIR